MSNRTADAGALPPTRPDRAAQLFAACAGVGLLALLIGVALGQPDHQFGESGIVTYFSAALLVGAAWFARQVWRLRRPETPSLRDPRTIWLAASLGFAFLTLDELLRIHESVDDLAHRAFSLVETGWSDRIDDLVLVGYLIVGLALVWRCRGELWRFRAAAPLAALGAGLTALMVAMDVVSNRDDILRWLLEDAARAGRIALALSIAEDVAKLFAEAALVLALRRCVLIARAA